MDNSDHERHILTVVETGLRAERNPLEIVGFYEVRLKSIARFTSRFFGDAGTQAVISRSVQSAGNAQPVASLVHTADASFDFADLRYYAGHEMGSRRNVILALRAISLSVFKTPSIIVGEALTDPLLRYLQREPIPEGEQRELLEQ